MSKGRIVMGVEHEFITIDDVSFSYENQLVLNHIKLSLSQGISYALIGKSGVGKSTLLNIIAGFVKPTQGWIMIDGQEIVKPRKNTAFLFQDLGLFPWKTVAQAVAMPLLLQEKADQCIVMETVISLLKEMEIEDLKEKYPMELSGGERQRVALARTLIGKPDLLLMDEPTSSLDSMTKESIQQLIFKYQQKLNATMLFITHDIEEAVLLGQRILLLNVDGSVNELDNSFFAVPDAKEQLGFYEKCIEIRKLIKLEKDHNEG